MNHNSARDIIRRRRSRLFIKPYIEHVNLIIKCQTYIRVFLAKKRTQRIRAFIEDEIQEIASTMIQSLYRGYRTRKHIIHENAASIIITNFIRRARFQVRTRNARLRQIRENLQRIRANNIIRRWINRNRYVDIPPPIYPRHHIANRAELYTANRNIRQEARQHNWDVLNRRLRVIRRDIDSLIPDNTQNTRTQVRNNRVITPINNAGDLSRRIVTPPDRILTRRFADVPARVDTNNNPRRNQERGRQSQLATPIRNIRDRTPIGGLRRIPNIPPILPVQPQIETPTIQDRVRTRLEEIQNQFQDPRIRDIYRNNRIIMPDGNRVLPGLNGGIHLQPDPLAREMQPTIRDTRPVDPRHARDCPICLETKADFRMINPGCGHLICFACTQTLIITALGNISTQIPIKCPLSTTGCTQMITPYTNGVKQLITVRDYEKYEKYHIIKEYVPHNRLRYCPNSQCGMPFEINDDIVDTITSPPGKINFRLSTNCIECETMICIYCNDYAHPNMSCREFQEKQKNSNDATSEYIKNYCKKCPICKVNVQKQQTREQELHEKNTGLAGGTSECHHVTCGSCKRDFCWTCLKPYTGAVYYHRTCPNEDCLIYFNNKVPIISNLPLGQHTHIKVRIFNIKQETVNEKIYQINNNQLILGANPNQYTSKNKTVVVHCSQDGVVKRIEGLLGDYSFRQRNKAIF